MTGIDEWTNQVHEGDARDLPLPSSSVHAVVTSPSYFAQRDYGPGEQIGLEASLDDYIAELVSVGRELRRVLRSDGNWWLNLGDTFAGSYGEQSKSGTVEGRDRGVFPEKSNARTGATDFRRKSKMLVPHRVAIALQEDGWIIRSDGPWVKTNYKPHPVKDRFVERKEFVFHLTPEPMYWWDLESIRLPHKQSSLDRSRAPFARSCQGSLDMPRDDDPEAVVMDPADALHPNGKNPGDVFVGPVSSYSGEHSATFSEWLPERPIKSSAPPRVCAACGTPYERIVDETDREVAGGTPSVPFDETGYRHRTGNHQGRRDGFTLPARRVGGWEKNCGCDAAETMPGIVLDPFCGSGTTLLVAKRLGRRFVGFDIDPRSVTEARTRVGVTVDRAGRLRDGELSLSAFDDGETTGKRGDDG